MVDELEIKQKQRLYSNISLLNNKLFTVTVNRRCNMLNVVTD